MGKRLSEDDKLRIFIRDDFKCQYCEFDASSDFEVWYHANLNVDHVNPNGTNDDSNLVTACRACNLYKWKHPCTSVDEAKAIVKTKRDEARRWFEKYVKKAPAK